MYPSPAFISMSFLCAEITSILGAQVNAMEREREEGRVLIKLVGKFGQ